MAMPSILLSGIEGSGAYFMLGLIECSSFVFGYWIGWPCSFMDVCFTVYLSTVVVSFFAHFVWPSAGRYHGFPGSSTERNSELHCGNNNNKKRPVHVCPGSPFCAVITDSQIPTFHKVLTTSLSLLLTKLQERDAQVGNKLVIKGLLYRGSTYFWKNRGTLYSCDHSLHAIQIILILMGTCRGPPFSLD